jgi:pyruvate dehydrogenase E1 component alpha subunit
MRESQAMKASNPGPDLPVSPEEAHGLLRLMLLMRRFEEKAAELYSLGKIQGFLHLYIGEEAVAAGAIPVLTPDDALVGTYREHGQALARGISAGALMAEMFGKANGCCRGRGGSMHLFDVSKRFYGGNAIVGGGLPLAVGLALAAKMQRRPGITACFFGDGAAAEGEFHESLNLAALWKLPVLFVCENNYYAMGTHLTRHQAQTDLSLKARSYAMPAEAVDGMDVLAVRSATIRAAGAVRNGGGPFFLEARTYRFRAHSMYDPDLYRPKEEIEEWKKRDPIATFAERLRQADMLADDQRSALDCAVANELADALAFAESGPWEPATDLLKDVYTPVTR